MANYSVASLLLIFEESSSYKSRYKANFRV